MKKTLIKFGAIVLLTAIVTAIFAGCSFLGSKDYRSNGYVGIKDKDGNQTWQQILSIDEKDENGNTVIKVSCAPQMLNNTANGTECLLRLYVTDSNGKKITPNTVSLVFSAGEGLSVQYVFSGNVKYDNIYMYHVDNEEGGVSVPVSELEL